MAERQQGDEGGRDVRKRIGYLVAVSGGVTIFLAAGATIRRLQEED
jgi:hypothetical protein